MPLTLGHDLVGMLLLDQSRAARDWGPLLPALTLVGHALANAIGRCDAELELQRGERRFRSMFDDNPLPAFIIDADSLTIVEINDAACERYATRSDLVHRSLTLLHPENEQASVMAELRAQSIDDRSCVLGPWHHRLATGDTATVELLTQQTLVDGRALLHCVVRDITAQERSESDLQHALLHDALTGLGSRALVERRLAELLGQPASVAVLILDLDGFKIINDSLGHSAGDHLLVETADRLRRSVRERDLVARIGGDEFAVLIGGHDAHGVARTVAERAIRALSDPFDINGVDAVVSASIGMSFTPAVLFGSTDADTMLRNADLAMYAAKDAGRGRLVEFSDRLSQIATERMRLLADLQMALRKKQLQLHYQPIVALDSIRLLGAEALLRWEHPTLGMVAPSQYLPLIEETPLVGKLGAWVLEEACRQIREWTDEMGEDAPAVAINVAPQQLRDVDFVDSIRAALARHRLQPSKLILEITERSLLDDADAVGRLQSLRDLGLRLSIDDFGTCYAALGYLRQLPVDILKIDRTFIAALEHEPAPSTATVAAITDFANVLGVETMAEGIEQPAQRALLQDMGCYVGQGYLFAKPAPAKDIIAYLQAHVG
ncbi:MAG: EAL domain-containing protein [Actinomycetota bacterium]|nr:EAL domain-containing protein [Actinomycetota bacterium]